MQSIDSRENVVYLRGGHNITAVTGALTRTTATIGGVGIDVQTPRWRGCQSGTRHVILRLSISGCQPATLHDYTAVYL
jgi:hypothetical protein